MSSARDPLAVEIGHRLRLARRAARISQAMLAHRLGLEESTYRSYELGDVLLPIRVLVALPKLLHRPTTYFLGLPEAPQMSDEDRLLVTAFQQTRDPELREVDLTTVERNFRLDRRARQAASG